MKTVTTVLKFSRKHNPNKDAEKRLTAAYRDLVKQVSGKNVITHSQKRGKGEPITLENFYKNTEAEFKNIAEGMESNAIFDYWDSMKESGKYEWSESPISQSQYLIDKRHGDVYRMSNHWGKVGTCYWFIDKENSNSNKNEKQWTIAKANIKDFKGLSPAEKLKNERRVEHLEVPQTDKGVRNAIKEIIEDERNNTSPSKKNAIADVTDRLREDIQEPLEDAIHTIRATNLRKNKRYLGQLTEDDYFLIPEIVNNYNNVTKKKMPDGKMRLEYEKKYPDGTIYYVEEFLTGKKELEFSKMSKNSTGDNAASHSQKVLAHTSETDSTGTSAIIDGKFTNNFESAKENQPKFSFFGKEREKDAENVAAAFEEVFKAIDVKEEDGKVKMFQIGDAGLEVKDAADRLATEALVTALKENAGLEVVLESQEAGEKIAADKDAAAILEEIRLNRSAGPSQSDTSMEDVAFQRKGAPTVVKLSVKKTATKIKNRTQSAKNNIKKFKNGDLKICKISDLATFQTDLRKSLALEYRGQGSYAVYNTPKGMLAFRFNNHNAFGDNFKQDDADQNISVYVAVKEFDFPKSEVPYNEYRYSVESFNAHKEEIFADIMNAVGEALETGDFPEELKYAEKKEYPETAGLVGAHNISADKLRKAIKAGGFANPSVAVINAVSLYVEPKLTNRLR